MSNFREFREGDRVSINKDLTYTDPSFSAVKEMKSIFTGTITHVYKDNDEVTVLLDYPDDVPESKRIGYSYDPRDLTLIQTEKKGNPMPKFNRGDKIVVDHSLKFTKKRFGITDEMKTTFTGIIKHVIEKENKVIINLDGSNWGWTYDLRDISLASESNPTLPIPTNVKTSKDKTTVEFSDNTTTSVKKSAGDPYDLETAIAYCIAKKIATNSHIKRLAVTAEEVLDKVDTEFYNKFLKPYGFLNETAYTDVEIETLKNYLKTLNDVRSDLALIAIENDLTKDELFGKLKD